MKKWYIKIEGQKNQMLSVEFNPPSETIDIIAECRLKNDNNKWTVFASKICPMDLSLEDLQENIEIVLNRMNKRVEAYKNLDDAFGVLKEVGYVGTGDDNEVLVVKNNNSDIVYGSLDDEVE